jgi:hypothetical protein
MGRWLSSVRGEASEKIQECPYTEPSKPSKPIQEGVLKVLKVPSVGISEKFSAGGSLVSGIGRPPAKVRQNEIIQQKPPPKEPSKPSKPPAPGGMPEAAAGMERWNAGQPASPPVILLAITSRREQAVLCPCSLYPTRDRPVPMQKSW